MAEKKPISKKSAVKETEDNKEKNPWQTLIFAAILILLLYFFYSFFGSGNSFLQKNNKNGKTGENYEKTREVGADFPAHNSLPRISPEELQANYRKDIQEFLADYEAMRDIKSHGEWARFSFEKLDKVFQMTVPADKKDFHLELAIALNSINVSATKADSEDLNKKILELEKVLEKWQ